ncbi:hypothetical protein [Brachyspira sp. G79]|uniref:hypothetical protein n=1 Tax=Brachyspira sp. G79 TaxID=1358104 RepID=UPI001F0ACB3F|nr:hypothetical protein [Brachyspira sp. G79]
MENENIINLIKSLDINNLINETLNINNAVFYKDTNALMLSSYFGFNDIAEELIKKEININKKILTVNQL